MPVTEQDVVDAFEQVLGRAPSGPELSLHASLDITPMQLAGLLGSSEEGRDRLARFAQSRAATFAQSSKQEKVSVDRGKIPTE